MKTFEINQYDLADMLMKSAEMGAQKALINAGLIDPVISRPQAIKVHGLNQIKLWEKMGIIERIQKGMNATSYYSVAELNKASFSTERNKYVTSIERKD